MASRARRYAKRAAIGVGGLLGFVVLSVFGLLFSLRFEGMRSFVVARVNGALDGTFKGRIVVGRVQSLGLGGISAADAQIFDPSGKRVIALHGLDVRLSVPTIVWAALTEKSAPLTIRLTSVSLKHADVNLIDDGTGTPTLAHAFEPKTPSAPSSGPGTIVILDDVQLARVWAHGGLGGTPLDVELRDAKGKLRTDDVKTAIAFDKAGIRARGLPQGVDPVGDLRASLDIPAAADQALAARAHYQGTAAQIPLVLDASFIDLRIVADVEASEVPPEAVARQVPGLALRGPARLHAHAEGKLPDLGGTFELGVGSGKVDGDFALKLNDDLTAKANVRARSLNLADVSPSAPATSLDADLHAAALVPKVGPITGNFEVTTQPSVIAGQSLPSVVLSGTFESNPKTALNRVEAHAEVAEPGAQTTLDATVIQGQRTNIEFRSSTKLRNAPRLKQLAGVSQGQGQLDAQGSFQVESQRLNARVRADLRNVTQGTNTVSALKLRADVEGALPQPNADVLLDVSDANLAGQQVASAHIAARGSLAALLVSGEVTTRAPERHVQLSARVSNSRGLSVERPSLNLRQGNTNLSVSATNVEVLDGRTRVNGLRLEGAGQADVSLVYGTTLESLHTQTYDLDLARLWRLVDPKAQLKSGIATVSLSYERRGGAPRARVTARTQNLDFDRIKGGSMSADLTLEDGRLDGSVYADLKELGKLDFDLREVRGINPDKPDPQRITGKLAIEGQMRLRDLNKLVPDDSNSPVARALGTVKYNIAIERPQASPNLPTFHVRVSTKKLQLAGVRDSTTNLVTKQQARDAAPLAVKGLDVDLDVSHEETGKTELSARVTDEHGPLLALNVSADAVLKTATFVDELTKNWQRMPLSVRLSIPRRDIEKLPPEVRPAGLAGVMAIDLAYDGTLQNPKLEWNGTLDKLRKSDRKGRGLDLTWKGKYDGARGKFEGSARAKSREVAKVDIDFETPLGAWLNRQGDATPPVDASAHLEFDSFPMGVLPATETTPIDGQLSGKVAVEHFGKDASVDVNLDVRRLKLSDSELGDFHTEIKAKSGGATALLRVDGKRGVTTVDAKSGLEWGARFVPEVKLPADAQLRARELRLAAFSPFVTSIFGELDGRLNGDLNAHFRGGAPELDGRVDLSDGVAQVASVGQRFDQIKARISLQPGKAKLDELTARATTGKLKVTGEARFAGLELTGADARLQITKDDRIALTVSGNGITDTWGQIDVKLRPEKAGQKLSVDIPELHVRMADAGSQDVQALDPAKGVRIGTYQRETEFVTLPLQPLSESDPSKNENPMTVDLNLGNQVWVQQGDGTKIQLGGRLAIVLGDPMTLNGRINLAGGKLDVSGKQFEVESGAVTFSGNPADPTIVATAHWDAQDEERHRVYVDFAGTTKKAKLGFRSEPPLTQDQILSLILTGSADGSLGGTSKGGGNNASTAVGAVGGAATQGINKALSGISDLDVSTRVDTSSGSARPEIVIQVSPKVSAEITRALGTPQPGQPPDLTFLTLNFRVKRNWNLSAVVGDRGASGLDLVWRKRY